MAVTSVPPSLREAYLLGREHLRACGVESPELEAEVLLRHAAGLDRAGLYLRWTQAPSLAVWTRYVRLLEARGAGTPTAYLLGEREFYGLAFLVDERVLVPRPETELLVDLALEAIRHHPEPVVVEVGTGSGAVAVALAVHHRRAMVYATDISSEALEVAHENARRHGVLDRVRFLQGDALQPVAAQGVRAHAVVSNPPYVPPQAMEELPPEVRAEPTLAVLAPGPTGTELHARIIASAPPVLLPGGLLALEVSPKWDQPARVTRMMREAGFGEVRVERDLAGLARVVAGRWPGGRRNL
ncbi:MAG: peptide chain release factor N(5)-glutamine methyltransferase [Armatimonadetes bacterium]|nr:peptide chain release factor N(5)-glutamine methyltransferase [Armatimonadota bacterium]MDW8154584.1 peptide chain release factor N(5)-glutamine methyltransferase [Armatimonadota bacterium]